MSQVNKLRFVDSKLGAPSSGQQTTRTVFHTVVNPAAGTTSLEFFKDFQGLTLGQSNLQNNKLDSMESMVIKSLWFAQINQNGPGSQILLPFGGFVNGSNPLICSVFVGNEQVVKDLPLQFNIGNGQAYDRLHASAGAASDFNFLTVPTPTKQAILPTEVRLLTDIVIPPQVNFSVRITGGTGVDFGAADSAIVCALSGYGKIFSAGASF